MVIPERSPWHQFAVELKRLRVQSGYTQEKLGKAIGVSDSLISAIENDERPPKPDYAETMDTVFSTGGALTRLWSDINKSLDARDWWRSIKVLEQAAIEIREYQMVMIPGLLQTAEYARTSMRAGRIWDRKDKIEQFVQMRTIRWGQLHKDVVLWFVVDEYTLTRQVGSPELMLAQLDGILDLIDAGAIRIQVITRHAPQHPGMSGGLRVLGFADRPPVALAEHWSGEAVLDDAETVRQAGLLFGALQGDALSLSESEKMIRRIREDYA
ncbi:helix-turn-helix transcriptional regulator [Nocardiopsis sp. YSL2]|uniref:helix-turn-helix domain-containing protein n=1 Tax=Nocardiopsis sp. YSL2 TaxID=2939492 RepID=UPI0026F40B28|nr:helix-turn-helix transcriptional regulator [Nocardiopsis sp. YSL2]